LPILLQEQPAQDKTDTVVEVTRSSNGRAHLYQAYQLLLALLELEPGQSNVLQCRQAETPLSLLLAKLQLSPNLDQ